MLRPSVRTREWELLRKQLKKRFAAAHITKCEFNYKGCWKDNGLTFAHAKKRRNVPRAELHVVALACIPCHDKLELMPETVMTVAVMQTISNRIRQP